MCSVFTLVLFIFPIVFNPFWGAYSSSIINHVTSPSGKYSIPTSLLRFHFPSSILPPNHELSEYIYEHKKSTNHILSNNHILHPPTLSPRKIQPQPASRYFVNSKPLYPTHEQGAIIHTGEQYTFIYDYKSGILLAGWGPNLNLKPLDFGTYPSLFVNIYHHEKSQFNFLIDTLQLNDKNVKKYGKQIIKSHQEPYHIRPRWKSEYNIFFDVALAFDLSFCAMYGSDPSNTTALVHGIGVLAHELSLTRLVSLRVGDVIGFCNETNNKVPVKDIFGAPTINKVRSCQENSKCSVPDLKLRTFQKAWKSLKNEDQSDAVYLFTSSSTILKGDVIGAAWVASACSDFGFGYIIGTNPIILAHEMGHTLGASHSGHGLMKPYLPLAGKINYNRKSLIEIDNFVHRLSGQNCLIPRHRINNGGSRFSGFTSLVKADKGLLVEGSDVAVGKVRKRGEVLVLMISSQKKRTKDTATAFLRFTILSRSSEKGFPFSYVYSYIGKHVKMSHKLDFKAGAGLAIASLTDDMYDDAICVMLDRESHNLFFIIGYAISPTDRGIDLKEWSAVRYIPTIINNEIIAIGATAGQLGTSSQIDLIIAYIDYNKGDSTVSPKYIIGYDLNGSTSTTRGWSAPATIDIPNSLKLSNIPEHVGDISVSLWPQLSKETGKLLSTSLLFSVMYKEIAKDEWDTMSCIVENVQKFNQLDSSASASETKCFRPSIKSVKTKKLTGGIALTRLLSSTASVMTSVMFQGRFFEGGSSSSWIDVGDGVLTKEYPVDPAQPRQLAISIGENIVPIDTCSRCYEEKYVKSCESKVHSCFKNRQFGQLEKVHSLNPFSIRRFQRKSNTDGNIKPNSDAIFCAGFHSIFISKQRLFNNGIKRCDWDSSRTSIVAEGIRVALYNSIEGETIISRTHVRIEKVLLNSTEGFCRYYLTKDRNYGMLCRDKQNRKSRWVGCARKPKKEKKEI